MREDKEIVKRFEAAISATWIYPPAAMCRAAAAITDLVHETTDPDEQHIIDMFAALLVRRAAEKEETYRKLFEERS
jgi:hypothetical protein